MFEGNAKVTTRLTRKSSPAARRLHPRQGAGRRAAHHRTLSPQRQVRRHRRSPDHPAAAEPRRPDLRDQRGPHDRRRPHQFHRQQGLRRRQLHDQIATKESRWWKFLASNDNYDPDRLEYDREQLRRYYINRGYADFRVVSAVAELTPDRSSFYLTYTLDEGARYKFGKIAIDSKITRAPADQLLPLIDATRRDLYQDRCRRRSTP